MSEALMVRGSYSMKWNEPRSMDDAWRMAEALARASIVPRAYQGKPNDILAASMLGKDLGMTPMQALRLVHVIQGKPVLAADAMRAVCVSSKVCEYFIQESADQNGATFETKRASDPRPVRSTFTIEDAKRAGLLSNDTWRKYPEQMCVARASAKLARLVYPDIVGGIYDPDELAPVHAGRSASPPPISIEVVEPEPVFEPDPEPGPSPEEIASEMMRMISETTTIGRLEEWGATNKPDILAIPKSLASEVIEHWKSRKASLLEVPAEPTLSQIAGGPWNHHEHWVRWGAKHEAELLADAEANDAYLASEPR